jgi:SWI/SNF-related matrix-associated actin-dependent regulator of chromatin subfamily A3
MRVSLLNSFHENPLLIVNAAHIIRNRTTSMARAACAIHATNRWAITGTPIQNRVTDFASLLEFLQLYPFSIPRVFDEHIARPWLKSGGDRDISSMKKLVNCISLCRTKSIIDLPKREDLIHHLDFSAEEHEFYNTVKEGVLRKLNEAVGSTPVRPGQYLNALQWLNELRLVCNHGLAHAKINVNKPLSITPQDIQNWNKSTANRAFETIVCHDEAICSMCGNSITDGCGGWSSSEFPKPILSKCLILTCGSCVKHSISGELAHRCPHDSFCKSIEVSWASENEGQARIERVLPSIQPERVSTKLKTLLKSLQTCYLGEKRYDCISFEITNTNVLLSVVFSYWTTTLDIIESLLRQSDISYTRIDGKHSGERREEAIEKFQTDEKVQVILVSITCGGAG